MRSKFVLLPLLAVTFALGCEHAVTLDNTSDDVANADATPDTGPLTDGSPDVSDAGPDTKDVSLPPDLSACAAYTPGFDAVDGGGHVGGGTVGCRVAVDVTQENGSPRLVMRDGTVTSATLTGNVLSLSCSDGPTVLLAATIRCFKGPGEYVVPAGALVLGRHVSDRTCRLDADQTEGQVRGFISCDRNPPAAENLFANTTAPIGLGVYVLTQK